MRYSEDIKSRFTARHRVCIEFSDDVKDKVVLDVGCWMGWYEKFMVEKGKWKKLIRHPLFRSRCTA